MTESTSVVYIVAIGKHVKIGFSTNLPQRLKSFETSTAEHIKLLASFRGGRDEEAMLHRTLAEARMPRGEFFHWEYRLDNFIEFVRRDDIASAWRWLDNTHPDKHRKKKAEDHRRRVAQRRESKAQLDAKFAEMVAVRKSVLGW